MTTEQNQARTARCHRIREAEGLVELATVPACRFGLHPRLRQQLAKRAIRLVLEREPEAAERWQRDLVLGQALRLLRKYDLAVRPLLASVRRNPVQRQGWIALGWCLKRAGDVERAANVAAEAIVHHPDDAVFHYNLACYLSLLQQSDLAISELIWALELKPQLRKRLPSEPDFRALRDNDAFQALVCQPQ